MCTRALRNCSCSGGVAMSVKKKQYNLFKWKFLLGNQIKMVNAVINYVSDPPSCYSCLNRPVCVTPLLTLIAGRPA